MSPALCCPELRALHKNSEARLEKHLYGINSDSILSCTVRASERKFSRGYEGQYRAPKSYWAPQALSGAHALKSFLSDGCRSSFKSEEITIYRIQLGPMKNKARHKIGLNPARGLGGAL